MRFRIEDWGKLAYGPAFERQEIIHSKIVSEKLSGGAPEYALALVEHPHVYTLGKNGNEENLLVDYIALQAKDAEFFRTNRGGDITYHGPGQLVGYPIMDLDAFKLGVRGYIEKLEESIIQTIAGYGVKGDRLEGATGVWLDVGVKGRTRKICAIGVRVSRGVTMHGFALNGNTDLNYFNFINPCGFRDKGVTSLEQELGAKIDFEELKRKYAEKFAEVFNIELINYGNKEKAGMA
ncbi:MAG: lipoyl(octanoyl) transferase LipB [Chloroflexota bacterium]